MSKENTNLRLLGSPVNLSSRSKKKDDIKYIKNRPRSALQDTCITLDTQERYKRPFSADTKDHASSTRHLLKAFSAELLQSYNSNNSPTNIKVVPPTADLLKVSNTTDTKSHKYKDFCCNASDYGSEDTHISLGTKIKAKAQLGAKNKNNNTNKFLKYRNIAKKCRKPTESMINEDNNNQDYGLQVKIIHRSQSPPSRNKNMFHERSLSPSYKTRSYESYFIPLDSHDKKIPEHGNNFYGTPNLQSEVEQAIDTYTHQLTKQQLSLVEEESAQDLESVPSQNTSSLSPENSLEDKISKHDIKDENHTSRNTYIIDIKDEDYNKISRNFLSEPRTYTSFYDDFRTHPIDSYKSTFSSTVIHTDSSSKDSGYIDSGQNDDKSYKQNYSLPTTSLFKRSISQDNIEDQPKSLDSISTSSNDKVYRRTFPLDKKSQLSEPLNHSRLLYKDFFLKKEGHVALPPQNSPNKCDVQIPSANESLSDTKGEKENENLDYPPYLVNSTTKAYTSKVIEDYKKELEAINSLHELTLKDIKTDNVISPTPLNIDKMFEESTNFSTIEDGSSNLQNTYVSDVPQNNSISLENKRDVSKFSTKELIQNYLKVKEGDYKNIHSKNFRKADKKLSIATSEETSASYKHEWNNKATKNSNLPVALRNQTHRNMFTVRTPQSARIEEVQNDKDVDSWMSLSAPSPRILELENVKSVKETTKTDSGILEEKVEPEVRSPLTVHTVQNDSQVLKELNPKSTVLDIYSMLKEIESYGDNPVTAVTNENLAETESKKEEHSASPKDNFMEIFEFLEKVEQSANDALSVVTNTTPQTIPKLEALLKLPQTELAQRLVTASLQLEERSCCIALLQESLANHKEQMINKVSNLEKQSLRNVSKVKQECEETIKRHQNFIDQLINDKKTLNHRIEQLVDERRSLEDRWKRNAQALEERYKLELRNQHDKMVAAQQVARQRWVRQKAEKIKELTVKGLEGELREMAERQQKEVSDLKMSHAEQMGRAQAKHAQELEELRRRLEEEKEAALIKERQLGSSRLEKQILELELTYQEQRTRLVAEMRAENERVAAELAEKERLQKEEFGPDNILHKFPNPNKDIERYISWTKAIGGDMVFLDKDIIFKQYRICHSHFDSKYHGNKGRITANAIPTLFLPEKWRANEEKLFEEKKMQLELEKELDNERLKELNNQKDDELQIKFEEYKRHLEADQQLFLKRKVAEITAQYKQERDLEIEKAIESMEAEAQAGKRDLQEALRRNKEQYEAELEELAETEQATLRRYQEAQARIRSTEDKCAELEVKISQLETRNKVLTEKNTQLEFRAEQLRANCEESWRSMVEELKKEIEETKKRHEEQMHQLYAKVKVAVARKDSTIQALTREAAKYQEKITLLEQKLQQQRKDFLSKK